MLCFLGVNIMFGFWIFDFDFECLDVFVCVVWIYLYVDCVYFVLMWIVLLEGRLWSGD